MKNKNKEKKIVFIIQSLQPGGMERVMSQLIDSFCSKRDVEMHLILYGINRDIFYPVPKNVRIHFPTFTFNNRRRFFSTLRTLSFLRSKITEIQPYSILSFGEYWNSFVLIALLGKKYPVFLSDRCQPNKSLGKLHDFLRRILYKKATGIIAQTSQAKAIYKSGIVKHQNIEIIGNPIIQQKLVLEPREKVVLSVGRLIESKHHNELIKLFVKLNKPDWRLIIVGGDALKQNNSKILKDLIKSLKAKDKVVLAGNQKDVASFYKKSSIFAFTSSSEGFPNVIGEALSFGLPVIAFDCIAGPSDMIQEEKNGNLIKLFDYNDFAKKLEILMDDEALRLKMRNFAPSSIVQFEKNAIGKKYFEFITQV